MKKERLGNTDQRRVPRPTLSDTGFVAPKVKLSDYVAMSPLKIDPKGLKGLEELARPKKPRK